MKIHLTALAALPAATAAMADGHGMTPVIEAADQSVADGTVAADRVVASEPGWLVVHRTDAGMKPGPVVGLAPLRAGETRDVVAILTEEVAPDDMLMLMVHSEEGAMERGAFEYTLGATEDGPVRVDGSLVMAVIAAE